MTVRMASDGELALGAYGCQVNDRASRGFPLVTARHSAFPPIWRPSQLDHTSLLKFCRINGV